MESRHHTAWNQWVLSIQQSAWHMGTQPVLVAGRKKEKNNRLLEQLWGVSV